MVAVTVQMIEDAAHNLQSVVKHTPSELSKRLSERYQANIYLKREDLQEVRSFKIRGAYNKIVSLSDEEKARGVVCASAGNHAQGVSYSCAALQIQGTIFMPTNTPKQKVQKVKKFGAGYVNVILQGEAFDDSYAAAKTFQQEQQTIFIHPFDDELVIAGQGTVAKEIYEELDGNVDYVFSSVGGGGLASGCMIYLKEKDHHIQYIGVEPTGAPAMYESLKTNRVVTLHDIDTFVDGAAVKTIGNKTFEIFRAYAGEILTVPEGKVCTTMIELYQNEGIIAEPAGALALAALDFAAYRIRDKNVVCIVSGGNNDILRYPEIMEKSLRYEGLKHYFIINFAQRPGQLRTFVEDALGPNDDIVRFEYMKKTNAETGPALVGIELSDKDDYPILIQRMDAIGFDYRVVSDDDLFYKHLV
ncbi:threonine ammonia-lyase IlvA [candidate division KSB3 bacterium]|uniref:L-threonine dehydratase n=1 Tax=candidate division KSB3 bacterium TaxID=2044937 RepID=A0A9D5Q6W2_9BACT|nr:threonine ammonia-lyase IlvA [candidate division KSB3 bacterium]MBD3325647.1 threonine ammonia-lyase IlvA [candidate division KSB3 bacterium]